MAVTILMGKAGSGKSSQCFKELQAWEAGGGKAMLLVPDQATYGCLLYTSPSPRDRTRSRMPSSA